MTSYMPHHYPDAAVASTAGFHGGVPTANSQFHTQDALTGQGHHPSIANANGDVYMPTMMDAGGDYYVPFPRAPRLPVAAARASSLAAMYYDPSLHPQHAYSHVTPAPWAVANPYHNSATAVGGMMQAGPPAPSYHHQNVERHLMMQNEMSKMQQPAGRATYPTQYVGPPASTIGVHHNTGFVDAQQSRQGGYAPFVNAAVPPMRWDHRWSTGGQDDGRSQHQMQGLAGRRNTAGAHAHSPDNFALQSNPCHTTSTQLNSQWSHGRQPGRLWDGQPQQVQQNNEHVAQARGMWPINGNGQCLDNQWTASGPARQTQPFQQAPHGWQLQQAQNGVLAPSLMPAPTLQQPIEQHSITNVQPQAYVAGQDKTTFAPPQEQPLEPNANEDKANAVPAPPSPDTLDKSSVPISAVGAEIVWLAAIALLDPSIWTHATLKDVAMTHNSSSSSIRRRMASHGSSDTSSVPSPFTSPLSAVNEKWSNSFDSSASSMCQSKAGTQEIIGPIALSAISSRFSTDPYDESSASSSEPGTPPTSNHSRIWERPDSAASQSQAKRGSLGALQGMRSLGLSCTEDARSAGTSERRSISPMDAISPGSRAPFQRAQSYDRARGMVTGVTDLLNHETKWSVNDDKLLSLINSQRPDARAATNEQTNLTSSPASHSQPIRRTLSGQGVRGGRDDYGFGAAPATEPSPAFRRFVHQVLAQTLVSPTAFMLGLMYSLRALQLATVYDMPSGSPHLDPEAVEIFAQPPSAAPFKLLALGLMIANKHLDDNTFLNKTWNEVTGITLVELNRVERWYLEKSSYEITVPEDSWVAFLEQLRSRTEQRISALSSAKRIRVPTTTKIAPDGPRRSEAYAVPHAGSEEAHKRFLLGIEEALHALGRAQAFDLTDPASIRSRQTQSRTPTDTLHHKTHESVDESRHRMSRPRTISANYHQHCHSAPMVGVTSDDSSAGRRLSGEEGEVDVFDDEEGPYRPLGATTRRVTMHNAADVIQRPSHVRSMSSVKDAALCRSISDGVATTASCSHEGQRRTQVKRDPLMNENGAPLAPSVLLDLLNRGQHLTHAAH